MASKKGLSVETVVNYVKDKWQVFGVATLIVLFLQFLSTKILVSLIVGAFIAALLPSDSIKKVGEKLQLVQEEKEDGKE